MFCMQRRKVALSDGVCGGAFCLAAAMWTQYQNQHPQNYQQQYVQPHMYNAAMYGGMGTMGYNTAG